MPADNPQQAKGYLGDSCQTGVIIIFSPPPAGAYKGEQGRVRRERKKRDIPSPVECNTSEHKTLAGSCENK